MSIGTLMSSKLQVLYSIFTLAAVELTNAMRFRSSGEIIIPDPEINIGDKEISQELGTTRTSPPLVLE